MKLSSLILMILMLGCGKDDSSSSSTEEFSLEGTWRSECDEIEDAGSLRTLETYAEDTLTSETFFYDDDECDVKANTVKTRVWNYELGDAVEGLTGTREIDYEVVSITYEILTDAEAETCNSIRCYGSEYWDVGEVRHITGQAIVDGATLEPEEGDKAYNIIKVDGDELFSGDVDTGGGLSKDDRPSAVNDSDVFEKQ
jgi:hypothetical protein